MKNKYDFLKYTHNLEISPTSRAKCRKCDEKIIKGIPRGIEQYTYRKNGKIISSMCKRFYCYKCLEDIIKAEIKRKRERKNYLKTLMRRISVKKRLLVLSYDKD